MADWSRGTKYPVLQALCRLKYAHHLCRLKEHAPAAYDPACHAPPAGDLERLIPGRRHVKERTGSSRRIVDWYKFDVFSAALVWMCVAVPALAVNHVCYFRTGSKQPCDTPRPTHQGLTLCARVARRRCCSSCGWVSRVTSTTPKRGERPARTQAWTMGQGAKYPMPRVSKKHLDGARRRAASAHHSHG